MNFVELKELLQYIDNNQRRIFVSKVNRNLFFNLSRIIIMIIITNVNKFIDDNNIIINLSQINSILDKKFNFREFIMKQKRERYKVNNLYLYAECVDY